MTKHETIFLVIIEANLPMSDHELRNKFKHWIRDNCHTTSDYGFEITKLAKPTVKGIIE